MTCYDNDNHVCKILSENRFGLCLQVFIAFCKTDI